MQKELFTALIKAHSEFPAVVKNRINPHLKNRYADLTAILDAVLPVLNRNALFLRQNVTGNEYGIVVETVITHATGESISSGPLFIPVGSNEKNKAQAYGSARTYACRYSLCSLLGISADDDDDGHAAGGQPKQQRPQRQQAPAPQGPSQDLIDKCCDAVFQNEYAALWNTLSAAEKKSLAESGWHQRFKDGDI